MLTAALFITAKKQKQPKCPLTDGYSDVVHTHTHTHKMDLSFSAVPCTIWDILILWPGIEPAPPTVEA